MQVIKSIHAVDSHTMGEPTRIIIGGIPPIPGKSMAEKKQYLIDNLDYIRTAVMHEPRGHRDMFGSIITQPISDEADLGIIFMDGSGYLNMCGHGSIGAATVAVETGMIEIIEPYTELTLDTPAGLVKARVKVENRKAKEVSIINVPSFLYKSGIEIDVEEIGKVKIDISFGGSFFILVKSADLGLDICSKNAGKLSIVGMRILKTVNKIVEMHHPILTHIKSADLVEIYGPAKSNDADMQNVVIFGEGQVDRSPCGTGTSAKMAALYSKGMLGVNEVFTYESIICTRFRGRILGVTKIGGYNAVIPEITGSAYITGFNHFIIDPNDPVKYGFNLG
jgi:proline racemase